MFGKHFLIVFSICVISSYGLKTIDDEEPMSQKGISRISKVVDKKCLTSESLNIFDTLAVGLDLPETANKDELFPVEVSIRNLKDACFPIEIEIIHDDRIELSALTKKSYQKCSCDVDGPISIVQTFKLRAVEYGKSAGIRIGVKITSLSDSSICAVPVNQYLRTSRYLEIVKNVIVEKPVLESGDYVLTSLYYPNSPIFLNETSEDKRLKTYFQIDKSEVENRVWRIQDTNITSYGNRLYTIQNVASNMYMYTDDSSYDNDRRIVYARRNNIKGNTCWNSWVLIPQVDGTFYIYDHINEEYLYTADKFLDGNKCLLFTWKSSNEGSAWSGREEKKRRWTLTKA